MSATSAWLVLFVAGLCEIGWAVGLKYTEGFSRLWPSAGTLLAMVASVVLLGWSLKVLPLGTAYGSWTGIGALGAVVVGLVLFKEPATAGRMFFAALLLIGIVGLKLTSPS